MENDQNLQKHFAALMQNAPVLMDIRQVELCIQKSAKKKIKSKTILTITATIGLMAGLHYFSHKASGTDKKNAPVLHTQSHYILQTESDKTTNKKESILSHVPDIQIPNHLAFTAELPESNDQTIDPVLKVQESSKPLNYSDSPSTISNKPAVSVLPVDGLDVLKEDAETDSSTCRFLILNDEELFRLGIISKENAIIYEETYSKKNPYRFSKMRSGNTTSWQHSGGNIHILSNKEKYPYLISDLNLQEASGILNRSTLDDTLEICLNHKKYIPVLVYFKSNDGQHDTNDGLIFWLPNNAYFQNLLPIRAQNNIRMKPDYYTWNLRTNRNYIGRNLHLNREHGLKTQVNESIPLVQNGHYLEIDEQNLSDWGFQRDTNQHIVYHIKKRHFSFSEYFKNGIHYIEHHAKSRFYYERAKTKSRAPIPLFISDSVFNLNKDVLCLGQSGENTNELQLLLSEKSKLIPVKIRIDKTRSQYYWYPYDAYLLKILTPAQKTSADKILQHDDMSQTQTGSYINSKSIASPAIADLYNKEQRKFLPITPLSMSSDVLKAMGCINFQNNLQITIPDSTHKVIVLTLLKQGTTIERDSIEQNNYERLIMPEYISDDLGKYTFLSFRQKAVNVAHEIDFDRLIPVLFKTGRSYTVWDMVHKSARPDYLLWFKPTQAFLSLLSPDEQLQIKREFNPDSTSKVPCIYSDLCKEQKINILNIQVYPNPAKNRIQLKVEMQKPEQFTYVIADLNGKALWQKKIESESLTHQTEIDLSDLEDGIYYLYVYSASGDLHIRKIVVMH